MDIQKIKDNVRITSKKCWIWKGPVSSTGYGNIGENGKQYTAHSYAYRASKGAIPKGKLVRHKCHNKLCCNPSHLELGTVKENYDDSKAAHEKADAKRRAKWSVDGIEYDTAAQAVEKTGISMNSMIKYTSKGVFDRKSYEDACKRAGTYPVAPIKKGK